MTSEGLRIDAAFIHSKHVRIVSAVPDVMLFVWCVMVCDDPSSTCVCAECPYTRSSRCACGDVSVMCARPERLRNYTVGIAVCHVVKKGIILLAQFLLARSTLVYW